MKFDCIVSNAPYDNGLHEKFESKYFDICDGQIVWVSPLSFLLGKKQNKRITLELDKYKTDIEQINGNEYFDAAIGGTMGIVFCDMADEHNEHYVKFDGKQYNKCEEIRSYSNDGLLMEYDSIINHLSTQNNLWQHLKNIPGASHFNGHTENNPNNNWWCIRIQGMRGHKNTWDFYTLISNTEKELSKLSGKFIEMKNKKIIQTNKGTGAVEKPYMEFYFAFNTDTELHNFINYIKTDFVRGLLYLHKTTMDLMRGELKYIPWFDFSDPVFSKSPTEIDDYLFTKYNISNEIRKHIEELLPDYYNIRKGRD